jgi:hypothetical protein
MYFSRHSVAIQILAERGDRPLRGEARDKQDDQRDAHQLGSHKRQDQQPDRAGCAQRQEYGSLRESVDDQKIVEPHARRLPRNQREHGDYRRQLQWRDDPRRDETAPQWLPFQLAHWNCGIAARGKILLRARTVNFL